MKITNHGFAVIDGDTHASQQVIDMATLLYEPDSIRQIQNLLKPGDVCVDAGALIGAYSRGMKDKVGPEGTVYSFEPNPAAFECLKHNCPDCTLYDVGLGDTSQWRKMHPDANAGGTWFELMFELPKLGVAGTRWFKPLDDWGLQRLDFLKIDVEGMEFEVLLGARLTLVRCRPLVWLEINHVTLARQDRHYMDIVKPLLELGYTMSPVQKRATLRQREWPQLDILFTPMA